MIATADVQKIRAEIIKTRKYVRSIHRELREGIVHGVDDRVFDIVEQLTAIKTIVEESDQ